MFRFPDKIRLATEEEVHEIEKKSHLTQLSSVYKFRGSTAVVRMATEIDPVFFAENASVKERMMFIWGLEHMLRGSGANIQEYFFNVGATDDSWQKLVEHWGAEKTSLEPEYRYRKAL